MTTSIDYTALYLAGVAVWVVTSAPIVAILTGWVLALRHQNDVTNRRIAFLEKDYSDRHGVHPFVVEQHERKPNEFGL